MNNDKARKKLINDLEAAFKGALAAENYSAAIKAKELLGKELGFFKGDAKAKLSLASLSNEDIENLLAEIEEHAAEYKDEINAINRAIAKLGKSSRKKNDRTH